jgi:hypothetical protein
VVIKSPHRRGGPRTEWHALGVSDAQTRALKDENWPTANDLSTIYSRTMTRGVGSRGIGPTQRNIVLMVRHRRDGFFTTRELASTLGLSMRRIQYAARALADRGLVEITLEPKLRIWNPGATERRRSYGRSIGAKWSEKTIRRPAHCGPGCEDNHVGADKQHWV